MMITDKNIDVDEALQSVLDEEAGAVVIFVGTVRNFSEAGKVKQLEYEAYESMAEKRIREIIEDAKKKWPLTKVYVRHRVGRLKLKEASVVVSVSAPHRKEAFESCRYIIDTLKKEAPIWKKERLAEGGERWVESSA